MADEEKTTEIPQKKWSTLVLGGGGLGGLLYHCIIRYMFLSLCLSLCLLSLVNSE